MRTTHAHTLVLIITKKNVKIDKMLKAKTRY